MQVTFEDYKVMYIWHSGFSNIYHLNYIFEFKMIWEMTSTMPMKVRSSTYIATTINLVGGLFDENTWTNLINLKP